MNKPFAKPLCLLLATALANASAHAATLAANGNIASGADWGTGTTVLPVGTHTISADAVATGVTVSGVSVDFTDSSVAGGLITINFISGDLTRTGTNQQFVMQATDESLTWNQSGGSVSGFRRIILSDNVTYNLSGGTITLGTGGSQERMQVRDTATFNMSGGALFNDGVEVFTGGVANFSGGTWTDFGSSTGVNGFSANGGQINISQGFTITSSSSEVTEAEYFNTASGGSINFASNWSGSFAGYAGLDWELAITDGTGGTGTGKGVFVNGTQVTGANFNTLFTVDGSNTLTLVPEPASLALLGLGGLGLLRRRRRA